MSTQESSNPRLWTKRYATTAACQTAAANHHWLASLGLPMPELQAINDHHLDFTHINGRHALPADLPRLAALLGTLHRTAYQTELRNARLDSPFQTSSGLIIPDFLTGRREALRTRLENGSIPHPGYKTAEALAALETAITSPAGLYKDSNPRNFLIEDNSIVAVDFDILTLAPPGYDLAKLIVTLAMTHGPHVAHAIDKALASYNSTLARGNPRLPAVSRAELMTWTGIHHVLTSPYLGLGGYRHIWRQAARAPAKSPLA